MRTDICSSHSAFTCISYTSVKERKLKKKKYVYITLQNKYLNSQAYRIVCVLQTRVAVSCSLITPVKVPVTRITPFAVISEIEF
jgi:hypothetical protein